MIVKPEVELSKQDGAVYYRAGYNPARDWLHSTWHGFANIEEVKAGAAAGLELIERYRGSKLLNDNTELQGGWSGANEWIAEHWTPPAVKAGLRYFAHIVSPDLFAAYSAEALVQRLQDARFELRTFPSEADAIAWLREQ